MSESKDICKFLIEIGFDLEECALFILGLESGDSFGSALSKTVKKRIQKMEEINEQCKSYVSCSNCR